MSLFEQVAVLFKARETKKASDFDGLVRAVADGAALSPEAIAAALEQFDRTPDDLQTAVERRQQRVEFARRLAEVPQLEAEKRELETKGSAETVRYEALLKPLQEEHKRIMDGLNGRYYFVAARIPQAQSMADNLRQTYTGPLQDELDANRQEQARLNREIHKILESAKRHENAASFTRPAEPDFIQTVRSEGKFLGVIAESTTWTKLTHAEPVRILSAEDESTEQAAAQSLCETAAEKQAALAKLVERETAILAEMLNP
jgi:hypothetical protein